jgi:GMP synthase (glutamine-hydrolysing)
MLVVHHLQRPFLGHARALGPVEECFGGPLPDLDSVGAIVSLGGESSAWELPEEVAFLREALAREIPVLGVCLGAQLLALAAGGEVTRLPRRHIAWEPIRVVAEDPVLGAIPEGAHALHWNQDRIELPADAVEVLARPDGAGAEGFRVGSGWGVQFHSEIDAPALDHWYADWGELLEPAGVTEAAARAADARHLPGQAALAEAIFASFARHARS